MRRVGNHYLRRRQLIQRIYSLIPFDWYQGLLKQLLLGKDKVYNEQDILQRIAAGEERAFVLLVEEYSAVVYTHVVAYIKQAARAEEITQDIFMKVWKHRKELSSVSNFRGYLYVITRNATLSAFREKMFRWEESQKDDLEAGGLTPAGALEYRELSNLLQQGIDQLPPRRKQVFTMSRLDNMSYEQIAQQLGISRSAVNQHIVEALAFLRTYLRDQALIFGMAYLLIGR